MTDIALGWTSHSDSGERNLTPQKCEFLAAGEAREWHALTYSSTETDGTFGVWTVPSGFLWTMSPPTERKQRQLWILSRRGGTLIQPR